MRKLAMLWSAVILAVAGVGAGWTWDEDHARVVEGSTIIA